MVLLIFNRIFIEAAVLRPYSEVTDKVLTYPRRTKMREVFSETSRIYQKLSVELRK